MAAKLTVNQLFACARDIASAGGTSEDWVAIMSAKYPQLAEASIERNADKSRETAIANYWKSQITGLRNILTKRLKEAKERKNLPVVNGLKLGLETIKFTRKESTRSNATKQQTDNLTEYLVTQSKQRDEEERKEKERRDKEAAELMANIASDAANIANGKAE